MTRISTSQTAPRNEDGSFVLLTDNFINWSKLRLLARIGNSIKIGARSPGQADLCHGCFGDLRNRISDSDAMKISDVENGTPKGKELKYRCRHTRSENRRTGCELGWGFGEVVLGSSCLTLKIVWRQRCSGNLLLINLAKALIQVLNFLCMYFSIISFASI